MADDIVSGAAPRAIVPVSSLREEQEQLELNLSALNLAIKKLDVMITARVHDLSAAYVEKRIDEQHARAGQVIDGLLTIAEANTAELSFRAELAADGCAVDHFVRIEYPVHGARGTYQNEVDHLSAVIDWYAKKIGYVPTKQQHSRLAVLGA